MSAEHPCQSYSMIKGHLGGFTASLYPFLEASADKDGDDEDANFSSDDEMTTFW